MTSRWFALIAILVALLPVRAQAHEIRPVSLDVREIAPGDYDAVLKVPAVAGMAFAVVPEFAPVCSGWRGVAPRPLRDAAVARFRLRCPHGLAGTRIALANLNRTMVDGLVRVQFASGQVVTQRLIPSAASFVVPAASSGWDVFTTYLGLGIEHILLGIDHLLFVLALVLLVRNWRSLLLTATAFTLAHSITLSLAALGIVHVPVPPVEVLIALSILYLAVELASATPARVRPWILALIFGLLHGLGFASALAEIGLPNHEIPVALFSFNVGVELGQIAFIAALLLAGALARWIAPRAIATGRTLTIYGIGSAASFWIVQRLASF